MKKLIISLLSLLMVFGLMMPISAEGETPATETLTCESDGVVACVGETGYATLEEAIFVAQEGDEVLLKVNYSTNNMIIAADKKIVLNLNGNKLTINSGNPALSVKGELTITGNGYLTRTGYGYLIKNEGKLIIENGDYTDDVNNEMEQNGDDNSSLIANIGDLTINGGTFTDTGIVVKNDDLNSEVYGTATINGGTFNGNESGASRFACVQNSGALVIENGEFNGGAATLQSGYSAPEVTLVINGGTFNANDDGVAYRNYTWVSTNEVKATVEVNNGTFNGKFDNENNHGETAPNEVEIIKGNFTNDVSSSVKNASSIALNDKYFVGTKEEMNQIASTATANDVVQVLTGITEISVPEGVKVENKTENEIKVNGITVEKGGEITVPKSTPTISCAGSKDKNCDGVVTCDEEKGTGWTWNNAKKVCEYTGNSGYQVVNTGVK